MKMLAHGKIGFQSIDQNFAGLSYSIL